jgi:hypothetical protein
MLCQATSTAPATLRIRVIVANGTQRQMVWLIQAGTVTKPVQRIESSKPARIVEHTKLSLGALSMIP